MPVPAQLTPPARRRCAPGRSAIVATLAIAGCSYVYLPARELPRGAAPHGPVSAVLTGSVAQPDSRQHSTRVLFRLRSVDGRHRFTLENAPSYTGDRQSRADPGLEAVNGRLFAVPVEPGEYEVHSVRYENASGVEAEVGDALRFNVSAGETLYIGSLEIRPCYSLYLRPDGQAVPQVAVGGTPGVRDESSRDLPLLRTTYPDLKGRQIAVRVLDGDRLAERTRTRMTRSCAYERSQGLF